jgi:hypothetical protein
MYAIIANHQNKTVIVEDCDPGEIQEPREALGFNRLREWAEHMAGYMARERGYEFVKEENESTRCS